MPVSASRVTASSGAVALNPATSAGTRLLVVNTDATNAVDLGGADVAANAGVPLAKGESLTVELAPGEVLYATRTTANDVVLAVLRT